MPLVCARAAALACVLAAALVLSAALAAPARAAAYGDGAAIPFLLLPADNPWNTPVDALPLDPNSADYIAHMNPATGLHPDFGTVWEGARIGIPYVVVPGTQPKVPISFYYPDESDPGPYPIPPDAPVEGAGGPNADGDRHVLVLDADNKKLYEVYDAHKQADGSWKAGSGAVFDLTSNALRPDGWTSADAAGLPILPGLARYDEIVGEGVLDHALRFTVADTQRAYVYPATHFASSSTDTDLPPMGLRVRLKADFDISGFPPVVQTILKGLKKYGMMVADNGSDWYVERGAGLALGRRGAARPGRRDRAATSRSSTRARCCPAPSTSACRRRRPRARARAGRAPAGSSTGPARSGTRPWTTRPAPATSSSRSPPAARARAALSR